MTFAVVILQAMAPAGATSPDAPREDYFGRSTPAPSTSRAPMRGQAATTVRINPPALTGPAPHPQVSESSQPQEWFDAFDTYVSFYNPTKEDEIDMKASFNQEVERVTKFCRTVAKVARNYRILAQKLKSLPIATSVPEARSYRDRMVQWYNDSALIYEDMIRPRPAARTKEELNSMIQDITERSEAQKTIFETLISLDGEIRLHHHVTPPKNDDALRRYAGHH